jgi:O-antigen/teichoic acid export membrane protein
MCGPRIALSMSTAKKILSNTAVQVAGRLVMAASSIFVLKMITNFLSIEAYGMYSSIYEFLAFFGIAADLGLFTIAVREMSKGEREQGFIMSNILGMRMALAFTMMSLATIAAFLIPKFGGTYIPVGVAIASMAVFFTILHGTVSSVLQVELKMQRSTIGLVGGKLISVTWMAAVVYYFYVGEPGAESFYQLIVAGLVGNIFAFGYALYYALKHVKFKPRFDRGYWTEIMTTSAPYGLALIMNMIYFRIDAMMLLLMRGPSEVALYTPVVRILEILSVIPIFFMNSVLPTFSKAASEAKSGVSGAAKKVGAEINGAARTVARVGSEKIQQIMGLSLDFLVMMALPMVIGLFLLAYPIVFLITQPEFLTRLDEGFYGSDMAMKILVFAMFFAFLNSLFTYSLVAINKQNHLLWINGSAAILNILVNLSVIPEYGFRGAAYASIGTEAYILLMSFLVARRFMVFRPNWGRLFKFVLASFLMGALVWAIKEPSYYWLGLENLSAILVSGIGAVFYGALLLLFGAIPKEWMDQILAKVRRGRA